MTLTSRLQKAGSVALFAVLAASGCETVTSQKPALAKTEPVLDRPDQPEGLLLTPLAESALPKGKCGMILWTLDIERPIAVFRFIAGEQGEAGINGNLVTLPLIESSGSTSFGVSEWQAFVTERGVRVDVSVEFGIGFDGGTYLEKGRIALEDASGWRTVAPAAGIAGCRAG